MLYQRNNSGSGQAAPPPAAVGECVVSDGQPAPNTSLRKATCGAGSFKIVKIFTGTSDKEQCATVAGATEYFAYKWVQASGSYVLCMTPQ